MGFSIKTRGSRYVAMLPTLEQAYRLVVPDYYLDC